MHTTEHKNTCPHCGAKHDAHSSDKHAQPGPGSLSICIQCSQVSVYDEDLQLRLPNNEEKFFIDTDPTIKAEIARIAGALAVVRAQGFFKK